MPDMIFGSKTPNLHLNKPDRLDHIYVEQLNENMDILDQMHIDLMALIDSLAPIDSPIFTGDPQVPLADGTNLNSIVNVQYLNNALEVKVL